MNRSLSQQQPAHHMLHISHHPGTHYGLFLFSFLSGPPTTTNACNWALAILLLGRYRQEFEAIKSPRNLGSYNHTTEGKPAWMAANLPLNTKDADHFDEVRSWAVISVVLAPGT